MRRTFPKTRRTPPKTRRTSLLPLPHRNALGERVGVRGETPRTASTPGNGDSRHGNSRHARVKNPALHTPARRPLTPPTLSPEQARGRGSEDAVHLSEDAAHLTDATHPPEDAPHLTDATHPSEDPAHIPEDAMRVLAPSPPSQRDGGEGWGEGETPRTASTPGNGNSRHGNSRHARVENPALHTPARRPLTPTLSPEQARGRGSESAAPGYAELHCLSNFSFQRGASSAGELFVRAKKLGYAALAITDECSLAGIVRAYEAAKDTGLKLIVGTEIRLADGPKLVVLAADRAGYTDICRLITTGRRRSAKGEYRLNRADAEQLGAGACMLWTPGPLAQGEPAALDDDAKWIMRHFRERAWLAVELHRGPDDAGRTGPPARSRRAPRPAAGRRRRRAHARAAPARLAGRHDRDPPRLHRRRCRPCAVPERRTPSAPHRRPRRALPAGADCRNAAHRGTLHASLSTGSITVTRRSSYRMNRRRRERVPAPPDRMPAARTLAERHVRRSARADREGARADRRAAATSTSS